MASVINIFFLILFLHLIVYLFTLYRLRKGLTPARSIRAGYNPNVSIIVSMHNEEKDAQDCIQSLLDQEYPAENLEIIIVDDRSTDDTAKIIQNLSNIHSKIRPLTIKDSNDSFAPKKYAIDMAVRQAKGEIIILTDADGRPGPKWVDTIISCFSEQVGMVIGYAPYITKSPYHNTVYQLLSLEYLSHAAIACASAGLNYPVTCVGTNMAYRKEVYEQINGFGQFKHIHTGDDDLFLQRVREETEWRIIYNNQKESQVFNAPPSSLKKFFHQRLRYASKGFLYPKKITISLLVLYIFNLLIFISPLAILINNVFTLPILIAFFLKAVADYHFLSRAATILHDRRFIHLFPFAFFLHIPYVLLFGLLSQIKQFEWGNRKS